MSRWGPQTSSSNVRDVPDVSTQRAHPPSASAFLAAVRKGLVISGEVSEVIAPEKAETSEIDTIMSALNQVRFSDIQTTQNNTPLVTRSSSLRSVTSYTQYHPPMAGAHRHPPTSSWIPHTIMAPLPPHPYPSEPQATSMNAFGSSWNRVSLPDSPSQHQRQPPLHNINNTAVGKAILPLRAGGGGGNAGIWLSGVDTSKYNNVGSGTKGVVPTTNGSCAASSTAIQGNETPVKGGIADMLSARSHTPIPHHHGQNLDLSISMISNQQPEEDFTGESGGLQETDLAALAEQHEATLRGILSDMHHTSEMEMDEVKMRSIMEWEAVVCGTDAFEKFTSQLQDLSSGNNLEDGGVELNSALLSPTTPKQATSQAPTPSSHLRAGALPFSPSSTISPSINISAVPTAPLQIQRLHSFRSNAASTTYSQGLAGTPSDAGRAPKRERQAVEKAERDALMVLVALIESKNSSLAQDAHEDEQLLNVTNLVDTHIEVSREGVQRVHNILKRTTDKQQRDDPLTKSSNTAESYANIRAHIISSFPRISALIPDSDKNLMDKLFEELASRDGRAVVRDWRYVEHRECGLRVLLNGLEMEGRRDILLKLTREVPGGPPMGYPSSSTAPSGGTANMQEEARRRYLEATTAVQLLHYHTLTDASFMKDAISIKRGGNTTTHAITTSTPRHMLASPYSPMKATAEPYTPPTQKRLHAAAAPYLPTGTAQVLTSKPTIVLGGLIDVVPLASFSNAATTQPPISSSSDSATIGPQSTATTARQQTPVTVIPKVASNDSGSDGENDSSEDDGEGSFLSTGGGHDVPLSLIQRHLALAQWWAGLEAEADVAKGALILEGEEQMARSQLAAAMQAADTHVTLQSQTDNNNELLRRCAYQHVFKVVLKLSAGVEHTSCSGGGGFELLLYPPGGTLRPSLPGSKHYKPPASFKDALVTQITALSPPHRQRLAEAATGADPHQKLSIVVYCTSTAPTTAYPTSGGGYGIPSITACTFTPVITTALHSDPSSPLSMSMEGVPAMTSLDLMMSTIQTHNKTLFKLMK